MGKLLKFDDKLKVEQVVGETKVQKIVKAVFEVPEQKPDIRKILEVIAVPKVIKKKIIDKDKVFVEGVIKDQHDKKKKLVDMDKTFVEDIINVKKDSKKKGLDANKVFVEGVIKNQILYVADVLDGHTNADPVHSFHGEMPFSEAVHIDITMDKHVHHHHHKDHHLNAQVDIKVEDVLWRIIDSRTVEIEVVIEIFVKLTEFVQIRVLTDLKGIGVIADRRKLKVESVVNEGTTQKLIRREFEIPEEKPDIEKIIKVETAIEIIDSKVIKDKVLFEGEIIFKVLYVADTLKSDQPVHHVKFKAPFTHFIELRGVKEGDNVQIHPLVETVIAKIVNSRKVRLEVVIEFFVKVTETKQLWVVTKAFGEEDIRLEKMLVKVKEVIGEDTKQIVESFTFTLADEHNVFKEGPDIEKIISVDSKAIIKDFEVIEDKVIIEGKLILDILFVADKFKGDQPVFFTKAVEPFTLFIDIPGAKPGMDVQFKTWVEDVNWRLVDSFTVDFDVIIKIFAKVTKTRQIELIIDAEMAHC